MNVKLLTEHHLEFLSLKGGYAGWSESTLVKMPHCWKSHVTAQIVLYLKPSGQVQVGGTYCCITVSYLPNKCRNSYFLQNYSLLGCNKGLDYMATQLKKK